MDDMDWPMLRLREPVSSLTHLATAVFAVYVTLLFVRLTAGDPVKRRCDARLRPVDGRALHGQRRLSRYPRQLSTIRPFAFFAAMDVSAIFVLIAGSFTPIITVLLTGPSSADDAGLDLVAGRGGIALKWAYPSIPHPVTVCTFAVAGLPGFLPLARVSPGPRRPRLRLGVRRLLLLRAWRRLRRARLADADPRHHQCP